MQASPCPWSRQAAGVLPSPAPLGALDRGAAPVVGLPSWAAGAERGPWPGVLAAALLSGLLRALCGSGRGRCCRSPLRGSLAWGCSGRKGSQAQAGCLDVWKRLRRATLGEMTLCANCCRGRAGWGCCLISLREPQPASQPASQRSLLQPNWAHHQVARPQRSPRSSKAALLGELGRLRLLAPGMAADLGGTCWSCPAR